MPTLTSTPAQPYAVAVLTAVIAIPALAFITACTEPEPVVTIAAAAHQAAWTEWRDSRTAWLATPGRPVSYTGLRWLTQGVSTVGGDSSNTVQLIARNVPRVAGRLVRTGNEVQFEPGRSMPVFVDSALITGSTLLLTDGDRGGPSTVTVGTAGFRILKRQDSIGVRTWDSERAMKNSSLVAPLQYFPLDSAWRIGGRLTRAAKPETIAVPTTAGIGEVHIIVGTVAANLHGIRHSLTAFAGNSPTDLYFTFSDETSGEETYGFRFLHAAWDTTSNVVTLDFNFAYNPDCAFSSFTTCPLPPTENRVPVRITAGEKMAEKLDKPKATASVTR